MNKSAKLALLLLLIIISLFALYFTIDYARKNPEYANNININETIVDGKITAVKYINILYIILIKLESLILSFPIVYLIITNFGDKNLKNIFENKSMILSYALCSLLLSEFLSAITFIFIL